MGTISKGILGGFSGTVGTVVGGNWKGIDYIRSQSAKRTSNPTQAQLEQQAKFSIAIRFITSLSGLLAVSFRKFAVRMTAANSAFAYLLKNAISGVYPGYAIDYSRVLVSRGDLPNADNPTATATAGSTIHYAWTDNSGMGKAKPGDKSILVVYCPAMNQVRYITEGDTRDQQGGDFAVAMFHGKQVQTWVGFISADGKEIATSVFTGQLTVT